MKETNNMCTQETYKSVCACRLCSVFVYGGSIGLCTHIACLFLVSFREREFYTVALEGCETVDPKSGFSLTEKKKIID